MKPSCANCKFWSSAYTGKKGFCKIRAPIVAVAFVYNEKGGEWTHNTTWPYTTRETWCGDWQKGALQKEETI